MNNFPINDKPSKGPMLGTIIIILIIIIGGIYIISSRQSAETPSPAGELPTDQFDLTGNEPTAGEPIGGVGAQPSGTGSNVTPTADNQAAALTGLDAIQSDLTAGEADLKGLETEIK